MPSIYQLKPAFQNLLRPGVERLYARGVTANQVTLAAAMLLGAGFREGMAMADPFCGSGTLGIEAALLARRMAPGLRRRFAFEHWPSMDPGHLESVRARAVERIITLRTLRLRGYHAHIGSQIFETEPFGETIDRLMAFAAQMRERHGVTAEQISPGGGFGIQYEWGNPEASVEEYASVLATAMYRGVERFGFDLPLLTIEPGRSIVGPAGVAVYRVGAIKDIPGVRRYVCVDGGMAI